MRVVPHGLCRYGAHLEKGVVMMPSYVNIGAYVGSGTMVDTWAIVGGCAQVGRNVHLSGGELGTPCALLRGERKASTDLKTSLNQALREFDVAM